MKETRPIVRVIIISVIALTLSALIAVSAVTIYKTRENQRIQSEYDLATQELRLEKSELMSRYNSLVSEYVEDVGVKSTLSFAFIDLAPILYDTVFPMFRGDEGEIGIDGILCFDKENIPGAEGRITLEQYREMLDEGWGEALYYKGPIADVRTWLAEMSELLGTAGISMPGTIVFSEGAEYTSAVDGVLLDYGIDCAVHYEADEFPLLEVTEGEGGVWHPGICGWLTNKVTNRMYNLLLRDGGHFFFAVGFDEIDRAYSYDPDNRNCVSQFARMLSRIRDSIDKGELALYSDVDSAKEYRGVYNSLAEEAARQAEAEKALIMKRVEEIDTQIHKMFDEYFG